MEENPEKHQKGTREWYKKNSKKEREKSQRWYKANTKRKLKKGREWRKKNPEKVKATGRKSQAKRRATLKGALNSNMGSSISRSLKGSKGSKHWEDVVGFTLKQLMKHLEKQFAKGMAWDNYGEWHIDHEIPISAFNFTKPKHKDFLRCWRLKNLQPMWAPDNISKHNKLTKHFQPSLLM